MRVKYKPWAKDYINQDSDYFINNKIESEELKETLKQYDKIKMEIGCGKGDFIVQKATNDPNTLYIAVEKQPSIIVQAEQKLRNKNIKNVKMFSGDIKLLSENPYFKNKISVIYINFSDPWPKKRHIKRRLTSPEFLAIYKNLLADQGIVKQKTDNDILFNYSLVQFANDGDFKYNKVFVDINLMEETNYQTEYELKFLKKGSTIKYLEVQKKGKNE